MPRTAKPSKIAEERQPALFQPEDLPSVPMLIEAAKRCVHTGKIAGKDEERANEVLMQYLQCGSLLATAKRFQVSPNTVKALLEIYEAAGKLDDLKQRVSRKLGTIIELTADRTIDALMAGTIQGNVLPIMLGVSIEKKALLDGDATSRVETVVTKPIEVGDIAAYLRTKGIAAPAIDVESTVSTAETKQLEGKT
jgi:hypothetical protein